MSSKMRKAVLITLLASMSNGAVAEWVVVSESDTATTYAEPTSIRRIGKVVRILTIHDFKKARTDVNGNLFTSSKSQEEFDCIQKRTRVVFYSSHAENLAKGKVVYRDATPNKWSPIKPNSAAEFLWEFVCKKKG